MSCDYLNICFDSYTEQRELIFKIYGINGNLVLSKEIKNMLVMDGFLKMDISTLRNGIYFIVAEGSNSVGFGKLSIIK